MPVDNSSELDRIHPQDYVRLHRWDWKGQPDFDSINASLRAIYDGTHCPKIVPVPDSHCDEYVVMVISTPISIDDVQELWDNWDWEYEEKAGRA